VHDRIWVIVCLLERGGLFAATASTAATYCK